MVTKLINLPKVLMQNNDYRLVATSKVELDHDSFGSERITLKLSKENAEDTQAVWVIAEKKSTDSLGHESWLKCGISVAVQEIVADLMRGSLLTQDANNTTSASEKKENTTSNKSSK